jgi:hypothetical protein
VSYIMLIDYNTLDLFPNKNRFCSYTAEENFATADAVFDCIGDPPEVRFDLDFCSKLLKKQYVS